MKPCGAWCQWLLRVTLWGVAASGLAWLSGCATPQAAQLQSGPALAVAEVVRLTSVPFVQQEDYACGPASLHMAMAAVGRDVPLPTLMEAAYLPARQGSLQVEMLAAVRRQGLLGYPLAPALTDVLRELDAGHPVVVFLNLSLPIYPVWHYAVAVGYDLRRNVMVLHSGPTAYSEMSLYAFERTWERGGHWAMVVLPPDQLPVTAQPMELLKVFSALEAVQPAAARAGYAQAVQRWPLQREWLLALGNAAYASHDPQAAYAAYQSAVQKFPDFAEAWNNLAQWYVQDGQLQLAKEAIGHALRLGGARQAQYQSLQDSLKAQ